MGYVEKGKTTMLEFGKLFTEVGNIEKEPKLEGRNMSMIIGPKSEKEKIAKAKRAAAEAAAVNNSADAQE